MPSLRARLVRQGFVAALKAYEFAAPGTIDPSADDEVLEKAALRMRAQMEEIARYAPLPRGVRNWEAEDGPVPGEWVVAPRADDDRVVYHLHGGGYLMGSPRTHRGIGAALSRTARARVFLPDYRLAPEHRFPAALDDAVAGYRWVVEEQGVDPGRLVVAGDSAGGGLAVALLVTLRDEGLPLPAAYVGISPWTDLACTGETLQSKNGADPWLRAEHVPLAARGYCGDESTDNPLISPLYADLAGLPPMLVHAGSEEILLDDARRLVERAREQGVDASYGEFDGLWHVFHAFPGIPESRWAWREIGAFVRRHTTPASTVATAGQRVA